MASRKRTTHRSSAGKKLYAVRNADGSFNDIQTYERAHRADLAQTSEAEAAQAAAQGVVKAAGRKKAKKVAKKAAKKAGKKAAKKAGKKKSAKKA